jgi:RNA polymerase sigma-70 factor (ECF subfamily)
MPADSPGPLDTVLDEEARLVLDRAVGALPAEQRAVFVLRAVEEMSYEEIARALEISPGTVMSRLFRARQRLLRAVAPYLGDAARQRRGGTR